MTATTFETPAITAIEAAPASVAPAAVSSPTAPLKWALRLEAAVALAVSVAVSAAAAGMSDTDATPIRLVAGGAMLVAILAFALGRHVRLERRWSYNASGLLQVIATFGIVAIGLVTSSVVFVLALLAAPAVVMLAMCSAGVRDALGQNAPRV